MHGIVAARCEQSNPWQDMGLSYLNRLRMGEFHWDRPVTKSSIGVLLPPLQRKQPSDTSVFDGCFHFVAKQLRLSVQMARQFNYGTSSNPKPQKLFSRLMLRSSTVPLPLDEQFSHSLSISAR